MRFGFRILLLLVGGSTAFGVTSLKTQETRLGFHLGNIHSEAQSSRTIGGIAGIATGVGLGIAAIHTDDSNSALLLGITAGLAGISGFSRLFLPSDFETVPERYRALPSDTQENLQTKVTYGETALAELGRRARRARRTGGFLSLGIGAAYLGWYAADSDVSARLYAGIVFAGLGLANFFVEHTAESEAQEYKNWSAVSTGWKLIPSLDHLTLVYRF